MTDDARLRWLLRRGMKELDVIVTRYYDRYYPTASEPERTAFARLLNQVEDPDIWAWAMGQSEPPEEYRDVIRELRRHH